MAKMKAPASGVTVRMYRQGHGDCFLLAMRKADGKPFYMLIDCGLKDKSEIKPGQTIDKVIADIAQATGNQLDVLLVTHEHEDHVNGFAKKDPNTGDLCFGPIAVGQLWLAWTEDGDDPFANKLRERFNDTLVALMGADERLGLAGHQAADPKREMLRDLLSFETGEAAADALRDGLAAIKRQSPSLSLGEQIALAIEGITNKKAIKTLRDKITGDPVFLRPDRGPYGLPNVGGLRVYALGPPRDAELLLSLDPRGAEEFHLALDAPTGNFLPVTAGGGPHDADRPFDPRFGISRDEVFKQNQDQALREFIKSAYGETRDDAKLTANPRWISDFFATCYGATNDAKAPDRWRQIDDDWLAGSEAIALRMNDEVNNTSLVIAIELPATGKVLLFTGDAQRGNWISWGKLEWTLDDNKTVSARDLLGRTVFYKVGHHGSHNATLNGTLDSDYANLSWLAQSTFKDEFVAMIPANTPWALNKSQPWPHPLQAIEDALKHKARGRVFRTDIDALQKPPDVSQSDWDHFKNRVVETDLYLQYTVLDS